MKPIFLTAMISMIISASAQAGTYTFETTRSDIGALTCGNTAEDSETLVYAAHGAMPYGLWRMNEREVTSWVRRGSLIENVTWNKTDGYVSHYYNSRPVDFCTDASGRTYVAPSSGIFWQYTLSADRTSLTACTKPNMLISECAAGEQIVVRSIL